MSIQTATDKRKFSQLRHCLRRLSDELRQLIIPSFSDKPVIKGSAYELKRKCGKPGCKCAQGELHSRMVVSASEKGKTILRVIPHGFLVGVQAKVRRYQELRRARTRLVEVHRKMIQVIDEMEVMRRQEVPVSRKKPNSQ
jgi:hypothetical protein